MTPKRKKLEISVGPTRSGPTVSRAGPARYEISDSARHRYLVEIQLREGRVERLTITPQVGEVSPREVRRLPLSTYIDAARALAAAGEGVPALAVPRGRPRRGRSMKFYQEILESYRALQAQGVRHPAKEIARRKRVSPNTVHQWVWRAQNPERRRKGEP